jgi:hypothetical protein
MENSNIIIPILLISKLRLRDVDNLPTVTRFLRIRGSELGGLSGEI